MRKKILKLILFTCVFIFAFAMFSLYAGATDNSAYITPNANQPQALNFDEIKIVGCKAVFVGDVKQMHIEGFEELVLFNSLEWFKQTGYNIMY